MKKVIFIDTGYWLALLNKKDNNHESARSKIETLKQSKIVISDFIIFETITFLNSSLKKHSLAMLFMDFIQSLENLEIIEVNSDIKITALELFKKYNDKDFSFTDCVSFAIMEEYNIADVFTFDKHFVQMGFHILI
ncbi:MAG: type II toxin-antitoxin system VapC family toxin [Spirochaetales bacterium]|nr:type II toxin-antitoxin system VapC family toxin [Spirochaetales bacterium]